MKTLNLNEYHHFMSKETFRWILQLFIQDHGWKLFFWGEKKKEKNYLRFYFRSGEMTDDIFFVND